MCTLRFPEIAIAETAPSSSQGEERFIDNTRNVGVVLGEKDIKQDVRGIKTRCAMSLEFPDLIKNS